MEARQQRQNKKEFEFEKEKKNDKRNRKKIKKKQSKEIQSESKKCANTEKDKHAQTILKRLLCQGCFRVFIEERIFAQNVAAIIIFG